MSEVLEFSLPTGQKLFLHWWKNRYNVELAPRGYVWIVHGLGEHAQRYSELATFLAQWGFDVLALDLPGHGLSRKQGYADLIDLDQQRSALWEAQKFFYLSGPLKGKSAFDKPWFIFGHSMGALLSLSWIMEGKPKEILWDFAQAAVVSAAPLKLRLAVPAWKAQLAEMLRELSPTFEITNGINLQDLSVEGANQAAYAADPLVHNRASPSLFLSLLQTAEKVLENPGEFEIPLCLMIGEEDPISDPSANQDFYSRISTHKKLIRVPEARHEIFNDISKKEVFEECLKWFL